MKKFKLTQSKKINHLNGTLQMLLSPKKGGSEHFIMGVSKVYAGEKIEKHVHDFSDECFFVLKGEGEIVSENINMSFEKDDCIYIPRGTKHTVYNNGTEELEVIFCSSPLAPTDNKGHRKIKE